MANTQNTVETLNRKFAEAYTKILSLNRDLDVAKKQNQELTSTNQELTSTNQELSGKIQELESEVKSLQAESKKVKA